ncbi:MAG TPA: tetratricopeptide repeat protein [Acidobacteriaceae bacterium]|nr:tetratricopeptide repeat protein [Acidobacteriaceae bacterium]
MTRARIWRGAALAVIFGALLAPWAQAQTGDRATDKVLAEAKALRAQHQNAKAEQVLNQYVAEHGDDANVLSMLAQMRVDAVDTPGALALLTRALTASPNSPAANLEAGRLLLGEHRDPEAMDRFETVLAVDLRNTDARNGEMAAVTELAVSARREGHPEAALAALEHARIKLPDEPQLLLDFGIQAEELGQIPQALEALQAARKLDPKNADVLYALARVDTDRQHVQDAEAELREYVAIRPNDATAHFGLGHVLSMQQKNDEARKEFQRSIELQPVQTESYYELGQMELEVQNDAAAEPLFARVLARDPKHGGALTGMGEIEFRKKDYAQAEQYLARAEAAAPEYQPAHYYRGLALARMGRKDESQTELATAAELDRKQQGPPGAVDAQH